MSKIVKRIYGGVLIVLALAIEALVINFTANSFIGGVAIDSKNMIYTLMFVYFAVCVSAGISLIKNAQVPFLATLYHLVPMFVRITFFSLIISRVYLLSPSHGIIVNLTGLLFVEIAPLFELALICYRYYLKDKHNSNESD